MAEEQWDMLTFDQGSVAVVANGDHLVQVCFERSVDGVFSSINRLYPGAKQSSEPLVAQGLKQLTEYFLGTRRLFTVPLGSDSLTPFACKVHQTLVKVPYGSVVSYGELAVMTGSPKAARAIGGVMKSNPFPLLVPCHRVVNADGCTGQYSAADGARTKSWLIDFERRIAII